MEAFSVDDVVPKLGHLLRAETRWESGVFYFKLGGELTNELSLAESSLRSTLDNIRTRELHAETAHYTDTYYEIFVSEQSSVPFGPSPLMRDRTIAVEDKETGFAYELSPVSDEYLIWLIAIAPTTAFLRDIGVARLSPRTILERTDALDYLRSISSSRLRTLKISSSTKQSLRRFQAASTSFAFQIAYNLDLAIVPQRFWEEISRRGRIMRIRRSNVAELDPPRRTYNDELVSHYILAVSTDNPTVQYLAFYHIIEFFFEAIFNDELIEQIKAAITQPSFSYKRKKDIGQLIGTIKKALQIRSETITFSESEALRLCLARFVNVSELVKRLEQYDVSLVEYYVSTEVPFSNGSRIAFRSGETERIIKELARRIYSTRNALVHSKDGDKSRYTPFRDERALVMEIPLMRFIGESIVLVDSQIV